MKRAVVIAIGLALMLIAGCLVALIGFVSINGGVAACKRDSESTSEGTIVVASNVSLDSTGLSIDGDPLDREETRIAAQIAGIVAARNDDFPTEEARHTATIVTLIAGMVESGLHNINYGDRDSLGIFQMRPSAGWGTADQVTNPTYAINKFLNVMLGIVPDWETAPMGEVAADVERPAEEYRYRYAERIADAEAIYARFNYGEGVQTAAYNSSPGGCAVKDAFAAKIEVAMDAALSKVGSDYTWDPPPDGASFVSWAYGKAGIKVPSSMHDLVYFEGDEAAGISASWIPASDVLSGASTLEKGDILFWSDQEGEHTRDNVTRTGLYYNSGLNPGSSFTAVSYNAHVGHGPAVVARIHRERQLVIDRGWDIVGFQEVENSEMFRALSSKVSRTDPYAVYPGPMKHVQRNGLQARAIMYNTDRFEPVLDPTTGKPKVDEIQFQRMAKDGRPQPAHAPVIWLRDTSSGQQIIVINTHSSAYARYANERYMAGKAYVAKIQELKAEGLPIIFTGDFNSGYRLRSSGNTTLNNDPDNLTYCQLTADNLMQDALDIRDGIADRNGGYCPRLTRGGPNSVDHIYVTPGVQIDKFETVPKGVALSDHEVLVAHVIVPGAKIRNLKGSLGSYVGPDPQKDNSIDLLAASKQGFVGALRLSPAASFSTVAYNTGKWRNPLPIGGYTLTDLYGFRVHPVTGAFGFHNGDDMSATCGTPVTAAAGGKVVSANYDGAWGNLVMVKSGDVWLGYPHMSAFAPGIQSGSVLKSGQRIGSVGETGLVTGCHLHFMVCTDLDLCLLGSGAFGKGSVDPIPFMRARGVDLVKEQ